MPRSVTLGKIEKEPERLTTQEQLKLLERLAHQLRTKRHTMKKELNWSKLYGLGKGLWKGINSLLKEMSRFLKKHITLQMAILEVDLGESRIRLDFCSPTSP